MTERNSRKDETEREAQAASWLARRDRGLTAAEQDAYLQWLHGDPRRAAAVARLEKSWNALDALASCRPQSPATGPDPDFLVQPSRRSEPAKWLRFSLVTATLAAAASIVGFFLLSPDSMPPSTPVTPPSVHAASVRVIPGAERVALTDGSDVELNGGARVEAMFTAAERRVRLVEGEAHFTVAKNPLRPFVVEVDSIAVRAVGTAFDVRRSAAGIDVLVTEGRVHLERAPGVPPTPLEANQQATVDSHGETPPVVVSLSRADLDRALAWRNPQLEFPELPLADVVAEFNRRNQQQLRVDDDATGRVRVAGRFRADNVDGFVRLLEASFGISAERSADGTLVLRRTP